MIWYRLLVTLVTLLVVLALGLMWLWLRFALLLLRLAVWLSKRAQASFAFRNVFRYQLATFERGVETLRMLTPAGRIILYRIARLRWSVHGLDDETRL